MPRVAKDKAPPEAQDQVTTVKQEIAPTNGSTAAIVEIPIGHTPPTSFGIHVELHLHGRAADLLRSIAQAYDAKQARLKNGERVVKPTSAIKKILEEIEEAQ